MLDNSDDAIHEKNVISGATAPSVQSVALRMRTGGVPGTKRSDVLRIPNDGGGPGFTCSVPHFASVAVAWRARRASGLIGLGVIAVTITDVDDSHFCTLLCSVVDDVEETLAPSNAILTLHAHSTTMQR
ncbi:hypothetical protein FISHEDRAFT_61808 [Fistulina hepatica ATCC 64428]|uniref:Uncharacterized protein n=1 Tax=Fistulina hepatica ATCC 64428 TaxID=1128425 RepID=A0A0D7A0F8_9AGAR|nr:hypothetical protein FISHEDRAFT_61808 [Fistulina hepatica ATCC 64428]